MNTYTIDSLTDKIKLNDSEIVIFEGFEMTGKSTIMNMLCKDNDNFIAFHNNYDKLTPEILPYQYRYVLGLHQIVDTKLYNSVTNSKFIPVLDRSIASSYVYNKLYNQGLSDSDMQEVVDLFRDVTKGMNVHFIHLSHESEFYASVLYGKSLKDNNHKDEYDRFSSFDEYWRRYLVAEELFNKFYDTYISNNWLISYYYPTEIYLDR